MADPLTYLEDLAARFPPEVGDAMREAIAAQRASHLEGARLMRIMEEVRLEEARRLESERDAALARAEKAEADIAAVTDHAVALLGSSLCDKHSEDARREDFATFVEKTKACGCQRCADARAERYREALDVIAKCPPEAVHLMPLAAQAVLADADAETKETT